MTHLKATVSRCLESTKQKQCPFPRLGGALIGDEEKRLVMDVLERQEPFRYYGWDAENPPPMAQTLEKEFCEKMGCKHALAVSNGTSAIEVALGALEVGPGDEVIVPAWSWISCWTAIVRMGALPVLAEIDETLCLAPGEITRLLTPRTKAVLIVHYQGAAADMEPLLEEARQASLQVIEDCAESPGVTYGGKRVGTLGDVGIYSFQYQKSMTSGEGGMVVTDDDLLYERAVRMHDLGQFRPFHAKSLKPQVTAFAGGQYRMTELQAAMALAQLRKLDDIRAHCRELKQEILSKIQTLDGLEFRKIPDSDGDTGFELYLLCKDAEQVRKLREQLTEWGVYCNPTTGTKPHYIRDYCIHRQTHTASASPFAQFKEWPAKGYRSEDFPKTEGIIHRFVAIPVGVLHTQEDAKYIAEALLRVYPEISSLMVRS